MEETSVVVIGAGPVGLTLANELSYRGVSAVVLESKAGTSRSPKAIAISTRSMEHFRRLGLQEKLQEASYPKDLKMNISAFTSIAEKNSVITQLNFSSPREVLAGKPGATFPLYARGTTVVCPVFCPQFTSEPILRDHLQNSPHVTLCYGWKVVSLEQDEEGVTVRAREIDGQGERVVRAKYAVGCDGGRSWARKQLGIGSYGKFTVARAVTVTLKSPELLQRMVDMDRFGFSVVIGPGMSVVFIILNMQGEFACHVIMPPDTTDEKQTEMAHNVRPWLQKVVGGNVPFTVTSADPYNMHAIVATKYRKGRCFLMGDAAHQWAPVGGLGMNTGISDAADLAWKLEAALKGFGGKHLLDSYQSERRPIADDTRRFAFGFLPSPPKVDIMFLFKNPVSRFVLGKLVKTLFELEFGSLTGDLILGFQYSSSNVIAHERNADGSVKVRPSGVLASLPGCRAPHLAIPGRCATIMDLFGHKFVLLVIDGRETDCQLLKEEMSQRGAPLDVVSVPKLPAVVKLYDQKYYLVRPDGVIAWRANYQPSSKEAKKIAGIVLGDHPPRRLLSPIFHLPEIKIPAVTDVIRSVVFGFLAVRFGRLSLPAAIGVGMGVLWVSRAIRTRPKPKFVQQSSRHTAVVINKFGESSEVMKMDRRYVGEFLPDDVLIRVHAASVNPLDLLMCTGYGFSSFRRVIQLQGRSVFPLILGRDCSGEVVAVGEEVKNFVPGDLVYAAQSPIRQGTFAQYAAIKGDLVAFKPSGVDHRQTASLPWAATTAWTALVKHGGLGRGSSRGKKVLVHGGTGGVGAVAIQMLKSWGAEVATTCSTQNKELARSLGADTVVDYTQEDFSTVLKGYDVVLDTVGLRKGYEGRSVKVLKRFGDAKYISIVSPRLYFAEKFGPFFGELAYSLFYRVRVALSRMLMGVGFFYVMVEPSGRVLEEVGGMVEKGEVRPLIDVVYPMEEMVSAHKHLSQRSHSRGKVVVTMV